MNSGIPSGFAQGPGFWEKGSTESPLSTIVPSISISIVRASVVTAKVELDGGSIDVLATTASACLPAQHRGIDHVGATIKSDIGIFLAFQQNIYIAECG